MSVTSVLHVFFSNFQKFLDLLKLYIYTCGTLERIYKKMCIRASKNWGTNLIYFFLSCSTLLNFSIYNNQNEFLFFFYVKLTLYNADLTATREYFLFFFSSNKLKYRMVKKNAVMSGIEMIFSFLALIYFGFKCLKVRYSIKFLNKIKNFWSFLCLDILISTHPMTSFFLNRTIFEGYTERFNLTVPQLIFIVFYLLSGRVKVSKLNCICR